jgi:hypothetical protein
MDIAFLRWKQKEERVGICFTLFFTSILLGLESMHGYLILGLACVCMRSPVGVFCLVGRKGENIVGWGFFFESKEGWELDTSYHGREELIDEMRVL